MKYKNTIAIILIMLFLSSSTVTATKIQKDDTWKYEDIDKVKYDEIALDVVQLVDTNDPVSAIQLQTDRPFILDLDWKYPSENISIDLDITYDGFYITQEGGIPFIPINAMVTGTLNNSYGNYNINDYNLEYRYSGDPSTAFITTTTVKYSIIYKIMMDEHNYLTTYEYIINTNNDPKDLEKNFTITPSKIIREFGVVIEDTGLGLNSFETAMSLTYEDGINMPTYVSQTEPVKTSDGLQLSSTNLIEYFLIQDDIISNEDDSYYPILSIISIYILILIKRKH